MAYFDHNATTPVSSEVVEAVAGALRDFGNPSSVHSQGRAARKHIEDAREQVAALLNAPPKNVIFTSGATEANNIALLRSGRSKVLASAIEHPSVMQLTPEERHISVQSNGIIDLNVLSDLLNGSGWDSVVSVMAANNESGIIQPVSEALELAHSAGAIFHCDAVQAVSRIPFDVSRIGADMVTISGHKIGGPKGVGALFLSDEIEIEPFIQGGGQERQRRGGTENVPGIVGFGVAAQQALKNRRNIDYIANLIATLEKRASSSVCGAIIFGKHAPRIPNTTLIALPEVDAETQVMALDLAGISVSAGSACSSGKIGESHVLKAMGVEPSLMKCAIRVSLGFENTIEEIIKFVEVWSSLQKM